jgi:hypothetical protein
MAGHILPVQSSTSRSAVSRVSDHGQFSTLVFCFAVLYSPWYLASITVGTMRQRQIRVKARASITGRMQSFKFNGALCSILNSPTNYVQYYLEVDVASIQEFRSLPNICELSLLLQLVSSAGVGVSEAQFRRLFVKCDACCYYMTRKVVSHHECVVNNNSGGIIDLTGDDD